MAENYRMRIFLERSNWCWKRLESYLVEGSVRLISLKTKDMTEKRKTYSVLLNMMLK